MTISVRRPANSACVATFVASALCLAGTALAEGPGPLALEEVVVTAQKKAEKLSETPLSVTAISSSQIEALGATQFRDIANTVPGLSITGNGVGQNQVNLRGIPFWAAWESTWARSGCTRTPKARS